MTTLIRLLLCVSFAAVIFSAAGADKSSKKPGPPPKYTVSGHISGMPAPYRATVAATASNKPRHTTTMTSDGSFILRNMTPGSYTLRPAHRLYTFSPSFRTVAVTDHDIEGLEFRAIEVPSKKGKR